MLPEYPDVVLEKVCVDGNPALMRDLGLRRYPALAHGEDTLTAVFLTKRKIRKFLARL